MDERDAALAALAAAQHGVVHRSQLTSLGIGPEAIRWRRERRLLVPLSREVLAFAGTPATWHRELWAAHLEAGADSVVARRCANRLHGLPGRLGSRVELLAASASRGRTPSLGELHTTDLLPTHHIVRVDGLPCTSVARTLFDLAGASPPYLRRNPRARMVHDARISRFVDNALARGLTSTGELRQLLVEVGCRGRRGTEVLGRVLAERGPGYVAPESGLEARFVALCRDEGLPDPVRQVALGDDAPIGRVDFLFPDHGVVVEIDGAPFHDGLLDRERDRRRDNRLVGIGMRVLRLREHDLDRPGPTAALVRAALATAAA